jgi:hypothetical protein
MSVPVWSEKPKKDNRRHEQKWAKARGGKPQPNSGRFWHAKFDVKDSELLTDNKQTERGSFSIRVADWRILQKAASREGLAPCLQVTFLTERGSIDLAVISADMITMTKNQAANT